MPRWRKLIAFKGEIAKLTTCQQAQLLSDVTLENNVLELALRIMQATLKLETLICEQIQFNIDLLEKIYRLPYRDDIFVQYTVMEPL